MKERFIEHYRDMRNFPLSPQAFASWVIIIILIVGVGAVFGTYRVENYRVRQASYESFQADNRLGVPSQDNDINLFIDDISNLCHQDKSCMSQISCKYMVNLSDRSTCSLLLDGTEL